MKLWKVLISAFILNATSSIGQVPLIKINNASIQAYKNKDYKTFLELTQKLDTLRPYHPTYTYNLAGAYALNNNPDRALEVLKRLVMMNNTIAFETDDDFISLRETNGYKAIIALKEAQEKVVASSKPVVTLSEKELHPEGLIYLTKSKTWLSSSIHKRKIIAFNIKTGKCNDWLTDDKTLAVFGMRADHKEEFLWVSTAAMPEMENFKKELTGKSEVLKIDIKTKQVVKAFTVKGGHIFGDLIVAKNGIVYVSDSEKPIVYKIENDSISEFLSLEKESFNLQGLAINEKQNKLFLADYLKGIAVIDIAAKTTNWLAFPEGTSAKGIDGLVFYKNSLIAIQNGVKPIRVTRFQLNQEQTQITGFSLLDNNRPEFNEPALATVVKDTLYFFSNSPWNAYDKNGTLDLNKVSNPVLYSCKLE